MSATLTVERTGYAVVQDLGRPGLGHLGITANGAGDQHAARTASVLVGNPDTAALLELTASELVFTVDAPLLMAVTGSAEEVRVDGVSNPAWEPVAIFPGSRVQIPRGRFGLRTYVAFNGTLDVTPTLGSVAPDRLMGVGERLLAGCTLAVDSRYRGDALRPYGPLLRLNAERPALSSRVEVAVTPGPDLARLRDGVDALTAAYPVSPDSDEVGLRLSGETLPQTSDAEILSRGVPVGAVEVPPSGGLLVLLRARLLTAGYPVVAVATSTAIDRLGQARPGDEVVLRFCTVDDARRDLQCRRETLRELSRRVAVAFRSGGLGDLLSD